MFALRSMQNMHTVYGQSIEFLDVKTGGTYSDQWALELIRYYIQSTD